MKKTNLCRCCLSSGCYKDLSNSYMCDGTLENYGQMLTNTFNLSLNCLKKFICEQCIVKLRDSATFKQQILEVDDTLNDFDDRILCDTWQPDPKKEVPDELSDVKIEPKEEEPLRVDDERFNDVDDPSASDNVIGTTEHISEMKRVKIKKMQSNKADQVNCTTKRVKLKNSPEKQIHKDQRENSIKLISNSNICLFKSLRTRFACYVCNEKFFDIKELRGHSKIHSTEDFKRRVKRLRGKSYENADISNLACNICSEACTDLDSLRMHLKQIHKIAFGDANHVLIPYKLEDGLHCAVCKDPFNTFTRLSIHMNSHATSNVCETCGMAFFNRVNLRNHVRAVHREHACAQCSVTFPTSNKLVAHKQRMHNAAPSKHYCLRCDLTFRYPYLLKDHMVEKHGAAYNTMECNVCHKIFKDSSCLKTHFRCVHLNERNYECSLCDLRFFTTSDRKRHEQTHRGGSLFACDVCETKFKAKDSMRRHMKRLHHHHQPG